MPATHVRLRTYPSLDEAAALDRLLEGFERVHEARVTYGSQTAKGEPAFVLTVTFDGDAERGRDLAGVLCRLLARAGVGVCDDEEKPELPDAGVGGVALLGN